MWGRIRSAREADDKAQLHRKSDDHRIPPDLLYAVGGYQLSSPRNHPVIRFITGPASAYRLHGETPNGPRSQVSYCDELSKGFANRAVRLKGLARELQAWSPRSPLILYPGGGNHPPPRRPDRREHADNHKGVHDVGPSDVLD